MGCMRCDWKAYVGYLQSVLEFCRRVVVLPRTAIQAFWMVNSTICNDWRLGFGDEKRLDESGWNKV